ncbi:hypothetical protein J2S30_002419 [Herbaspirillum rubrisubalbicans]|nr:hypothetical protein [Herbaspirillum rubrisubalbicans]
MVDLLKKKRRTFGPQGAIGNFGHFQMGRNRMRDAFQLSFLLQFGNKVS